MTSKRRIKGIRHLIVLFLVFLIGDCIFVHTYNADGLKALIKLCVFIVPMSLSLRGQGWAKWMLTILLTLNSLVSLAIGYSMHKPEVFYPIAIFNLFFALAIHISRDIRALEPMDINKGSGYDSKYKNERIFINSCFFIGFLFAISIVVRYPQKKEHVFSSGQVYFPFGKKIDTISFFNNKNSLHPLTINVVIGERDYTFLFDTGFSQSVINTYIPSQTVGGFKGSLTDVNQNKYPTSIEVIDTVQIGEIKCSYANYHKLFLNNFDGVIGGNFLKQFAWKIDFANKKIMIAENSETFHLAKEGIPFELVNDKPYLSAKINGVGHYFLLDLGCDCFVEISSDKLTSDGELSIGDAVSMVRKVTGYNSNTFGSDTLIKRDTLGYFIGELQIQDNIFEDEIIKISPLEHNLLGLDFCSRFDYIVIDYPNRLLYFGEEQHKSFEYLSDVFNYINTIGLSVSDKKIPTVTGLSLSLANKGIDLNDTVVAINNVVFSDQSTNFYKDKILQLHPFLKYRPSGFIQSIFDLQYLRDTSIVKIKKGDQIVSYELFRKIRFKDIPDTVISNSVKMPQAMIATKYNTSLGGYTVKDSLGIYNVYPP